METDALKHLLKVVEMGSITAAAEALFISQPALSKTVRQLEDRYDITIFHRRARGVDLTADGRKFVYYARSILTAENALKQNFFDHDTGKRSRLFLASQQLDFIYKLLRDTLYSATSGEAHRIHYNLIETDRNDVTRKVLNGEADLGLFVKSKYDAKTFLWHTEAKRLEINYLAKGGVFVGMGPSSPLYDRLVLELKDLDQATQVLLDMEAQAKQQLCFDSINHHFNADRVIFVNTISACQNLLLHTDAISFISPWTLGCFDHPDLRILPIDTGDGEPPNQLLWIKRTGEALNPTENRFIQLLTRHFKKS